MRSQLSKETLLAAFPVVVRLLQSRANAVHSYAAIVIEKLLSLNLPTGPLFQPGDVSAHLQAVLQGLFAALAMEDSRENEYLMKCVMRVIVFVGPQIVPIAGDCLGWCALPCVCLSPFSYHEAI